MNVIREVSDVVCDFFCFAYDTQMALALIELLGYFVQISVFCQVRRDFQVYFTLFVKFTDRIVSVVNT